MKIIEPHFTIESYTPNMLKLVEKAARVCYKSKGKNTLPEDFIRTLIRSKHTSVLEHGVITVHITCDRGISHELVRHRIASYSQESTRYCNYSKDKFNSEISVIDISTGFKYDLNDPMDIKKYDIWERAMASAEAYYLQMLDTTNATPEEARSILPNSTKTEIIITANIRSWRNIFEQRCDKAAHPQMREIMIPILKKFVSVWPPFFDDISY